MIDLIAGRYTVRAGFGAAFDADNVGGNMLGLGISLTRANLGVSVRNFDFTTGVMPSGLTFTRASTATYIGSDGLLKTAAVDEPRFDYDPVTLACKGLLIEGSRTNLLTYSSDFTVGSWTKSGAITGDATAAPSSAMTADFIGTDGSQAQVFQGATIASGAAVSGSVFLKAGALSVVEVVLLSSGNTTPYARATFDLAVGVISVAVTTANGGTNASAKIENYGNGWFRCAVIATYPATTSAGIRINSSGTSGGFYAWGAQLEAGAFASSYIPTTSAAVTRAADSCEMTGTNFSRWFNPTEGTLVFEAQVLGYAASTNDTIVGLFGANGATDKIQTFLAGAGPNYRTDITSGGVNSFLQNAVYAADIFKTARCGVAWSAGSAYSCSNFNTGNPTDTTVVIPSVNKLSIGTPNNALYIRSIRYWPRRLSNTRLQETTA